MGLNCSLYRASAEEIDGLIDAPETLPKFLDEMLGPSLPVREVKPKGIWGFLLKLTPITITEVVPDSEREEMPEFHPSPDRTIEIGKAWHGLHFLFTGQADGDDEPACYLNGGGEALDDEGFARALRPNEAQRFSEFLARLTPEELRQRYDPRRMDKLRIYPEGWATRNENPPAVEWLLDSFTEVRTFVTKAAAGGDGLIVDVS
jgi:hypothetical protein